MGKIGKADFSEMKKFQKALHEGFGEAQRREFIEVCANKIAEDLKKRVHEKTPRGNYSGNDYVCEGGLSHRGHRDDEKRGGTLRDSWNFSVREWQGDKYVIELVNSAKNDKGEPYAVYVEYGHRTRNGNGWVPGHFMLEIAKEDIEEKAQGMLENLLKKKLGEIFKP